MDDAFHREETLFDGALALPPAQRDAFLARACGGDATLRDRVLALLREHDRSNPIDSSPAAEMTEAASREVELALADASPGAHIGRYKLLERIGEGGCGVVFRAEQQEPVRREVALKIIKLGMDTRQVIARFEAERQALALMEHPHIARVLDAGATATGRPYFVMELVKGIAITRYCDDARLPPRARLELFVDVCRAIQHAHYKGVIHRDIKPSNLLVAQFEGAPVAKVIDFGVAKAIDARLTDKTLFTMFGHFIGTPAYMSPEQASLSAVGVDTRSDVYSLGVVLYELLTGRTPFSAKELIDGGVDEMRRRLREDEPSRPSTQVTTLEGPDLAVVAHRRQIEPAELIATLRGELDWIVMRCLEKDPGRRYRTVEALGEDLRRFLRHEPISVMAPSGGYVLRKLVRRHRLAFAAGGAGVAALLVGAAISTVLFVRERAARERAQVAELAQRDLRLRAENQERIAQAEAARSAEIAQFMQEMLKGIEPAVAQGRDTRLLREIVDATAPRLDALGNHSEVQADLSLTLGTVYAHLGEVAKGVGFIERALVQRRRLYPPEHPKIFEVLRAMGAVLISKNEGVGGEKYLREAMAVLEKTGRGETAEAADLFDLLGKALQRQGRLVDAEPLFRRGVEIARNLPSDDHRTLALALLAAGWNLQKQERFAESEPFFRESLAFSPADDPSPDTGLRRASILTQLGYTLAQLALVRPEKLAEAEATLRQALELDRRYYDPGHPEIGQLYNKLGNLLRTSGRLDEAVVVYLEGLELRKKLLARDPTNAEFAHEVVAALNNLSDIPFRQNRPDEAEKYLQEAMTIIRHSLPQAGDELLGTLRRLGRVLVQLDRPVEAEATFREAILIGLDTVDPRFAEAMIGLDRMLASAGRVADCDPLWARTVAVCGRLTARQEDGVFVTHTIGSLLRCGRFATAESLAREHLAKWEKNRADDWHTFALRLLLGNALAGQKNFSAAEPLLLSGCPGLWDRISQVPTTVQTVLSQPFQNLVQLYTKWGQPERAVEWQQKHAATQRKTEQ